MVLQMKYSSPYLIAGILALLVIGQSYSASGQTAPIANHVVVNEVELNPVGDYTTLPAQWVELYNPTNSPVNIGGWTIGATSGLKQSLTISLGTTIQPQQFIVYHYVKLWFPQAGAVIQLTSSTGTIIDQTPPLTDTQGDGNTWQRLYDGYNTGSQNDWVFKVGTPGFSNGSPPTTTVSSQLTMSLSTDKQNYIFGDMINISGQVSQIVQNPAVTSIPTTVNLVMSGPNGFKQTFSLYPGTNLKFSTYAKTDQVLGFSEGTYTISASYGNAQTSTSTTFSLGSAAFVAPAQAAPTAITISTDSSNYTLSQPIVLQGTVSKVIPLTPVTYKVYDPNNVVVYQGTIFPDTQGKLTTVNQYQRSAGNSGLLINSVNPIYGIYRVTATYDTASTFTTFELISAGTQSPGILVNTDKKVYAPGDTVVVSGSTKLAGLQNSGLSPTIDVIQVSFNSGSIPVSFHTTSFVNIKSDNSFTYTFVIPAISDRIGNYGVTISLPFAKAYTSFAVSANPSTYVPVASGPFSMSTDKSSYGYGDSLLISGQVRPDMIQNIGVQVMVSVFNAAGSQIYSQAGYLSGSIISQSTPLSFAALPDVNGFYSIKQNIVPNIFSPGTYTLQAHYGSSLKTSTTFTVSNLLNGTASNPITASTDKKVYGVGNAVQLNGQISSSVGMDSYTLTLTRPSGNKVTFPLQVNNGMFSWTWTIPSTDTTGSVMLSTDRSSSSVVDPTLTVYGIYRITISSAHSSSDLFFQVSQNSQPNQDLSPIAVETDKTNYLSSDVARIWGQVIPVQNYAANEANPVVQVLIYSNDGQQVYRGDATVNQGGLFYVTVPFHTGIYKTGIYKLYAEYLTNKIITSFQVTDPYTVSSSKLQLFMTTDSDKYLPGQTVLLTGRTSYIVTVPDGVDLAFGLKNDTVINEGEVSSLKGNNIPKTTVQVDQFGSFSYNYKIPNNAKLGTYTIIAQVPFGAFNADFDVVNQLPIQNIPVVTNQTQPSTTSVNQTTVTPTVIPMTIGPVQKHTQSNNMFVEKINKIQDSVIPLTFSEQSVGNMTYYPRQLDALLRVNPGDENNVGIKVNSKNGTCVIGPDPSCLVTKSTVQNGMIYQNVKIDGTNFLVGYSGGGLRLQQFSIIPVNANDVMPDGQWNVNVIKKDQITRFYYQVTYIAK